MKDIEAEGQKGEEDVDTEKEVVVERREGRVDRAIGGEEKGRKERGKRGRSRDTCMDIDRYRSVYTDIDGHVHT